MKLRNNKIIDDNDNKRKRDDSEEDNIIIESYQEDENPRKKIKILENNNKTNSDDNDEYSDNDDSNQDSDDEDSEDDNDEDSKDDEMLDPITRFFENAIKKANDEENKWLDGLSDDEKKRYIDMYDEIKKVNEKLPNKIEILKLDISIEEKSKLFQKLERLNMYEPYSKDYMYLRDDINKLYEYYLAGKHKEEKTNLEKLLLDDEDKFGTLKERIIKLNAPEYTKTVIYRKFLQLQKLDPSDSEFAKINNWIELALSLPYETSLTKIKTDASQEENNKLLSDLQNDLDNKLYGMQNVKEELITIIGNTLLDKDSTDNALALLGPPGVGKTELIRSVAGCLGLPFEQISLGGETDPSFLSGHSLVYEGSHPGIIAKTLIKFGCKNGIIFFDEIDKLMDSGKGREVAWNLLHITDFTQNNEFRDKYFDEIPIDLSKIFFIYSMNDPSCMDSALYDRMPIINVDGYSINERIAITKNYILPKHLKRKKLDEKSVIINDDVCKYIISKVNNDVAKCGIRNIEKFIVKLVRIINLHVRAITKDNKIKLSNLIENFKIPYILTKEYVDKLINKNIDNSFESVRHIYM
jgi:ATP-dependent Lon protease